MSNPRIFSCKAAACVEPMADSKEWSIYLYNEEKFAFDCVELIGFGHSGGGHGSFDKLGLKFDNVPSKSWLRLWRDDDFELRMYMRLRICADQSESCFLVDFPKVYRRKKALPIVPGIGLTGVTAPLELFGNH